MAEHRYAARELLVKFREGVTDEAAGALISKKKATVIDVNRGTGVYHILLPQELEVEEAVKEFSSLPEVQYAEPNYIVRMQNAK